MADLDSILSGNGEATPAPESAPVTTTEERPRDEHGRFAPKSGDEPVVEPQPTPQAPVERQTEPQPAPQAPVAAITAERAKRQEAETRSANLETEVASMRGQLQQFERMVQGIIPKPKPPEPEPAPDWYADPNAAMQHGLQQALSPIEQRMEDQRQAVSRMLVEDKFGTEPVETALKAMEAALQSDPSAGADYERVMRSQHPYASLIAWHKRRQTQAEIGDDPVAYRERVKAELLAEMQGGQAQPAPAEARPAPVMPSNLAAARGVGNRTGPAWGGPASLQDIFDRSTK